ncbi:MAG: hypothetical protein ACHBN1_22280 [Heteroscytonema crispum UTEX LB 1556]
MVNTHKICASKLMQTHAGLVAQSMQILCGDSRIYEALSTKKIKRSPRNICVQCIQYLF